MSDYQCCRCKKILDGYNSYEYRGFVSCEEHFDEVIKLVDAKRSDLIERENAKISPLKGLDISPDSVVGRMNRRLLSGAIEVASKEHPIEKEYRTGKL
ncbi:hypothetical protein [Pantoea sp. BAV 3049]|uniref:hypothetical protein n=1 Tax=Pantoea sp. BAV 3049 TaxID=2654188 RepID=UPI00131D9F6A|nr:hypothetical protein [Pantoea sp. BAV 3049]